MLGAAGDPDVWAGMNAAQQQWVMNTLTTLNNIIYQQTGTMCSSWGPSITLAGGCFQQWYNANYGSSGVSKTLRTDGVFDQDTLNALVMVAGIKKANFPTAYPASAAKKLSTGEMFGIAAAAATVIGGVAYVATHKKSRRRKKR